MPIRFAIAALLLLPALLAAQPREQDPDIVRYLRDIVVEKGRTVPGDVVCIYCSIHVLGTVQGDAVSIGGNIEVAGSVKGDTTAAGGWVRVLSGGRAEGDVDTMGGAIEVQPTAVVTGQREDMPYVPVPGQWTLHPLGVLALLGFSALAVLLGGLIFRSRRCANGALSIRRHPLLVVFSGLVLLQIWVVLLSLRAPNAWVRSLDWIANLMFLALLYCGYTSLAWMAGEPFARSKPAVLAYLAGGVLLGVAMLVPLVGAIVFASLFPLCLGTALVSGMGRDADSMSRLFARLRPSKAAARSAP